MRNDNGQVSKQADETGRRTGRRLPAGRVEKRGEGRDGVLLEDGTLKMRYI